jgi:hypothetical protein
VGGYIALNTLDGTEYSNAISIFSKFIEHLFDGIAISRIRLYPPAKELTDREGLSKPGLN